MGASQNFLRSIKNRPKSFKNSIIILVDVDFEGFFNLKSVVNHFLADYLLGNIF